MVQPEVVVLDHVGVSHTSQQRPFHRGALLPGDGSALLHSGSYRTHFPACQCPLPFPLRLPRHTGLLPANPMVV